MGKPSYPQSVLCAMPSTVTPPQERTGRTRTPCDEESARPEPNGVGRWPLRADRETILIFNFLKIICRHLSGFRCCGGAADARAHRANSRARALGFRVRMSGNEIVTLQFGSRSAHVAAHLFSLEVAGADTDQPTDPGVFLDRGPDGRLRPRTVVYDYSGTLRPPKVLFPGSGSDRKRGGGRGGGLARAALEIEWGPGASLHDMREDAGMGSPSPATDGTRKQGSAQVVRFWNDFAEYELPRRRVRLQAGLHAAVSKFNYYTQGRGLANTAEARDAYADDTRRLLEACDSPQGLQVLADLDSGFGGLAGRVVAEFRDEYPKKSILTWGLGGGSVVGPESGRNELNYAVAVAEMTAVSTVFVPLMTPCDGKIAENEFRFLPNLKQSDDNSLYRTTAPLAATIHNALLPSRVRGSQPAAPLPLLLACLTPLPRLNICLASATMLPPATQDEAKRLFTDTRAKKHVPTRDAPRPPPPMGVYASDDMQPVGGLATGPSAAFGAPRVQHYDAASARSNPRSRAFSEGKERVVAQCTVFRGLGPIPAARSTRAQRFDPRAPEAQGPRLEPWQELHTSVVAMENNNSLSFASSTVLPLHRSFPPLFEEKKNASDRTGGAAQRRTVAVGASGRGGDAKEPPVGATATQRNQDRIDGEAPLISRAMVTNLRTSTSTAAYLSSAARTVQTLLRQRRTSKAMLQFRKDGMEEEDWTSVVRALQGAADAYVLPRRA